MPTPKFQSVTLFASFVISIDSAITDDAEKGRLYSAIAHYSLYGEEPDLTGVSAALFELMRPNIDVSNKRKEAGKMGGKSSKLQAKNKQTVSKKKANCKRKESKPQAMPSIGKGEGIGIGEGSLYVEDKSSPYIPDEETETIPENNPETPPQSQKEPDAFKDTLHELKCRVNTLFRRKETTAWDGKEIAALRQIAKRPGVLDEMKEIEDLYNSGYEYCRRDIRTFLNNWATELDRANNRKQRRQIGF